jgi:class 3 adenylate cyclase
MRPTTYKALLLIADISGFTQFMKSHTSAANHAMQVVVELLKAVISAAAAPLELAEVEGDAAFFYAICREDGDFTRELTAIKKQVMSFFRVFYRTLHRLCAMNRCACEACASGATDLRLKVIIHTGEVAIEHIHGFNKLFGMDVILAHRLLKNSVPSQEYVLMTELAYNWLGDFHELKPVRQTEHCEGIGVVETVVFYPPAQLIHAARTQPASWWPKPEEELHLDFGPYLPRADFQNEAHGRYWAPPKDHLLSQPIHHGPRGQPVETVWVAQLHTKWRRDDAISVADLTLPAGIEWDQAEAEFRKDSNGSCYR